MAAKKFDDLPIKAAEMLLAIERSAQRAIANPAGAQIALADIMEMAEQGLEAMRRKPKR